jgi:hypothetical protein
MAIKNEIIDELLKDPKQVFSSTGLMGELRKALADRILSAEMERSTNISQIRSRMRFRRLKEPTITAMAIPTRLH